MRMILQEMFLFDPTNTDYINLQVQLIDGNSIQDS